MINHDSQISDERGRNESSAFWNIVLQWAIPGSQTVDKYYMIPYLGKGY